MVKYAFASHVLRGYPPGSVPLHEPDLPLRRSLFRWVAKNQFDGIEAGSWWFDMCRADQEAVVALHRIARDEGTEILGYNLLRKNLCHPAVAERHLQDIAAAIASGRAAGAGFINVSLSLDGSLVGVPERDVRGTMRSPGSSRDAAEGDFEKTANLMKCVAREAASAGIEIYIELHHCSLADNCQSMIRLLGMIDEPNVTPNPDLVNMYWAYNNPEEEWFETLNNLSKRTKHWHLKNVQKVAMPEADRSAFLRCSLSGGDIDYRWAIAKMLDAGFDGTFSFEGAGPGDVLTEIVENRAFVQSVVEDFHSGNQFVQ